MDLSQIGVIAAACIISAGGVGGIVIGVIKFSSGYIADKLQKKYELKLSKELETYKTALDSKSYISKARFDKEFQIYQSISSEILDTVFESGNFILRLKSNSSTQELSENIAIVNEKYSKANAALIKCAPFIDSNIYDDYKDICCLLREFLVLCQFHITTLKEGRSEFNLNNKTGLHSYTLSESKDRIIELRKQISDKSDVILGDLRNYLSSRDVLE